jgi:hypothetical protein
LWTPREPSVWEEAKPSSHFVQCMALDNQISAHPVVLVRILKRYSVFFETIVLNRMFVLNDPDLQAVFRARDRNGVMDLVRAGAVTFIKGDQALLADWDGAWARARSTGVEPAGFRLSDRDFVARLSDELEGQELPARFVRFSFDDTAPRFHQGIHDIWVHLDDRFKRRFVTGSDCERMDDAFGKSSTCPGGFDRAQLLRSPGPGHEWGLDIPERTPAKRASARFSRMMQQRIDVQHYPGLDEGLRSKLVLKQIVDLAYNGNLPRKYAMSLGYHDAWPDVRKGFSGVRPAFESQAEEFQDSEHVVDMADLDALSFPQIAALLSDDEFRRRKDWLRTYVVDMGKAPRAEPRLDATWGALLSLTALAARSGEWAATHGLPTTSARIVVDSKRYTSHDPAVKSVRMEVDSLSIEPSRARSLERLIEFEVPIVPRRKEDHEGTRIVQDQVSELQGA